MAICRGCGAEIRFIRLRTGKVMPVDPFPVFIEDGSGKEIIITEDGRISNGRPETIKADRILTKGYISHFATCPQSATFRRRKSE